MKGADSKVNLYKEKGGRLMICHPYFVKKTRFSAQMKQKTGLCLA